MYVQFIKIINRYLISLPYTELLLDTTKYLKVAFNNEYFYRGSSHTYIIRHYDEPVSIHRFILSFPIGGLILIDSIKGPRNYNYIW